MVASEGTDVFVLSLAFENLLPCKMFMKSSKQTRTVYIDISKVVLALGSQVCLALPGLHAFTGCDRDQGPVMLTSYAIGMVYS